MKRTTCETRACLAFAGILAFAAAIAAPARADDATLAPPTASSQSPAEVALGVPAGPSPDQGLSLGGFLVYPKIFAGVIFNDNVYPTQFDRKAAVGFAFAPNVTAIDDQGLHKTTLTLSADAEIYPSSVRSASGSPSPSNVSGVASIEHVWKPTQDLTVDATAGFTRQFGLFGSLLAAGSNFVSTTSAGSVASYPQFSNQVSASISVEKKISDQWFLRGGFGAQDIAYESVPTAVGGGLSGADYNAFVRSGVWVTPQFKAKASYCTLFG